MMIHVVHNAEKQSAERVEEAEWRRNIRPASPTLITVMPHRMKVYHPDISFYVEVWGIADTEPGEYWLKPVGMDRLKDMYISADGWLPSDRQGYYAPALLMVELLEAIMMKEMMAMAQNLWEIGYLNPLNSKG